MLNYRSLYPNHVHQMMVNVSKHYYVTKDGRLKYQQKKFKETLVSVQKADRSHMITMLIRDHCSGLFYAEIGFGPNLPNIYEFLRKAWSTKTEYPFCGLPNLITISRTVLEAYPELEAAIQRLGVELIEVTSGFQGGIRDLRTVEESLTISDGKSITAAHDWLRHIHTSNADSKARTVEETKLELWNREVPALRFPVENWPNDT